MDGRMQVAVVGCGQMGMHHAAVYRRMSGVHLACICEANDERRAKAAQMLGCEGYADMESMYGAHPELDAVSITMPDNLHVEAVRVAIAHGVHILLEKPLASTLPDGKAILDMLAGYDRVFLVGHILRYDSRFYALKEAIDAGELGEIIHISCRRNSPITGPRRYIGASDLSMHVMIHDIDAVNWFLKSRPVRVFAKARSVALKAHGMQDVIYAIITYENGVIANLEASWVLPETSPTIIDDQAEVVGTRGTAYIDACDKGIRFVTDKSVLYPDSRHWPYVDGAPSGALYAEIAGFIGAVAGGGKPLSTARDAYLALTVVDAIEASIREGREVDVHGV